jgi:type IV secretion system protein VirD4
MSDIDLYRPTLPTTFGSASWATMRDLRQHGMLDPTKGKNMGPIIGCLTPAEIGGRDLLNIYAPGEGNILTAAPTRAGKGRGQVITNLLGWPGSAVVVDIKGENWDRTAGWRQQNGHRVIRFAPFEQGSAKWNPIDALNYGCADEPNQPSRQEHARYLANLMIVPNPKAHDPYWDNAAKTLLQGLMMFVATAPVDAPISITDKISVRVQERTMAEVRRLLTQEPIAFKNTMAAMAQSPESWVRETAGTMFQMEAAREQSASVKSVLMEHTTVWSYKRVQDAMSTTTFSFSQLRGERPTTIYLVIPFEALHEYRILLRVMIGWCMRELRYTWSEQEDEKRPPVLFFLDEFPQLAHMQPIEEALLYIGAYGVKLWFFIQDFSMLQQHYEKTWRQFIANCATRCFFGVSDMETAKIVSEMSGAATVRNRSYQAGTNESDSVSHSTTEGTGKQSGESLTGVLDFGWNWGRNSFSSRTFTSNRTSGTSFTSTLGYIGRPLFMPDEILRMPFGSMIALPRGMAAIRGQLRFWDEDVTGLRRRGMIPPP